MTSANEGNIVGTGDIGSPVVLSEEKTMLFNVYGFEGLVEKKQYKSTEVTCFGFPWFVSIFPWGETNAAKEKEMVSIYLHEACGATVKAKYSLKAGKSEMVHVEDTKERETLYTFNDDAPGQETGSGWGWPQFMKRSEAMEALDEHGTLRIEVKIRIWGSEKPLTWKPVQPEFGARLYKDEDKKDVTLSLGDGKFVKVHSAVLSIQCPTLHEFVSEENNGNHVEIDNVDADLYATMIRFMYLESLPCDFKLTESGVDLLKLANRFGYTNLKMFLEAELIESNAVNVETAAEYLLLADSNSFALLKEVALDIIAAKHMEVKKTKGWEYLKESKELLAEVLDHMSEDTVHAERISNMRRRLAEAGLDVDGTKEMLVKRCHTELN